MTFSIRKYDVRNKTEYSGDNAELFQMMKEFFASPAVLHNVPESHFETTLRELENGSPYLDVYIFEVDRKIVGYGAVTKTYSNEAGGHCFWFDEIYIRKEFRGKGLGSTFIKQIIAEHPEVKRFRLETDPENEAAVRLYKALGFKPLGYNQFSLEK